MGRAVCIDGVLVDPGTASIPVLDRGFLYGDSAFEVLRTYGGQPFALTPHLERLVDSLRKLEIPLGVDEVRALRNDIFEALDSAGNEESYVRIIVTRGVTPIGLSYDPEVEVRRIVVVLPLTKPDPALYEGCHVVTVATARTVDGTGAAGAKASNYLANILSLSQARQRGGHEAILVGLGGELLEGSTSNLFLVLQGRVVTPRLGLGILSGITRRVVFAAAEREGIAIEERVLFPSDLYGAEEAFITSSIREVMPVTMADGVRLDPGADGPGTITARLRAAFTHQVEAWVESR